MKDKHHRFVTEYLKDYNAANAARRAGYAEKRARKTGYDLLRRDDVQTALAAAANRRAARASVSIDETVHELSCVLRANVMDFMTVGPDGLPVLDFSRMTREQAAAIAEIIVETSAGTTDRDTGVVLRPGRTKVRVKMFNKLDAADKLMKHLGGYIDREEIGRPGDFAHLSDEELNARLVESAKAIGIDLSNWGLLPGPKPPNPELELVAADAAPRRTNGSGNGHG